jgi:hypothetical protein
MHIGQIRGEVMADKTSLRRIGWLLGGLTLAVAAIAVVLVRNAPATGVPGF